MENFEKILAEIPKNVKLVAVSKTKSEQHIINIYNKGHKIFGENKVQELVAKFENLPKDIEWHMIGHLQTNKVKLIAPFVSLIHSVDSLKLLEEINKRALQNNRIIDCLLEIHIAKEESKFGYSQKEAMQLLNNETLDKLSNIRIVGLMGMASYTDDKDSVIKEFQSLTSFFKILKDNYPNKLPYFKEISMGMSGDYKEAIFAGATMVRIGSLIFGSR
ncbi:MAG: YggS family pyridoxal phosphate-dependent enzyme [Bacteroidales bacterium]|nr:YggS family pyridoxal phosphate-dependent enzyme [Bacteroidales bacterium]